MVGVKGQVQSRGVARRAAIIDAAIEHFARDGYRGTGIAKIAEQAGVTTGGLLHHFGSKEQLLVGVLQRRDEEAIDAFKGWPVTTVEDLFARWVEVATWNEERAPLTALYTTLHAESLDPSHPAHDYFRDRNKTVTERLARSLRRAIDEGELRDDIDVEAKATEIIAFIEGSTLLWLRTRTPGALRAQFESFFADQFALMSAGVVGEGAPLDD